MTKEEILEKSRQENKNRDERERETQARAGQKAVAVGGIVCGLIILLESFLAKEINMSTWAVYLSMTGTMLLVKYQNLKRTHELVCGVAELLMAAAFLVGHVIRLMR